MNKISPPLKHGQQGSAVADLQDVLQRCLAQKVVLVSDDATRRELSTALRAERHEQMYGDTTRRLVSMFQRERKMQPSGEVDEATATALNGWLDILGEPGEEPPALTVKGKVYLADGSPAAGVAVSAFDRDLRSEQLLGRTQTDQEGFYQIPFSASQIRRAGKGKAHLVVRTVAADGSLLVASPVLFDAPPVAEVDLTIPTEKRPPLTLFERIRQALDPVLEGLKIEELEEDQQHRDLTFLSGKIGLEKEALARFVLAHKLAQQSIEPEFWFALLGRSLYHFNENQHLQAQLVAIMATLPSLNAATVHKALIRGLNQVEIPKAFRDKVDVWIEAFLAFVARWSMSEAARPTFVKSALEHAGIHDAKKQETFARLFNEHKALTPGLLRALEKDKTFNKAEIEDLHTSFRLAELTRGDFPFVKTLKEDFDIRQLEKIRTLAKRSEAEWVEWVRAKHASGEIRLPLEMGTLAGQIRPPEAEMNGKMLERQFREAFPTTAFAGGLERTLKKGRPGGLRHAEALAKFLERHEGFELLNTPVDEFFQNGVHSDFQDLAKDDDFRLEVKAVQRLFKLAPTFEATDALLADGLHTARQIYRMGKSQFMRRYADRPGFTDDSARLAWNRAADTHAAVLTVVGDLLEFDAGILPGVLKSSHPDLASFPNWNNLFHTGDRCECEDCRSVLSPAAYLADLLMFLKDRKPKPDCIGYSSVKDILLDRRPDLGYLELSCDNARTTLPYIDVVCEVLEHAVDAEGENDLELPDLTYIDADAVKAKADVAQAFKDAIADQVNKDKEQIDLGADFSLSQIDPGDPDRWVVHGDNVTYLLKKEETSNFFAEILPNTKASADELRAYPQFVNPMAYGNLRQAQYPLNLPFDLFAEQVRAGFQKTNLQRWDLMRAFRGAAAPTDGDIAAEYFEISTDPDAAFDEKRLILVADATSESQQAVWGEMGNTAWLDVQDSQGNFVENSLCNVKYFLQKTGLEYNALLALLDLKFINPVGEVSVSQRDASCDTGQKGIDGLDATKVDRIHRFLRLWRKLKTWKMWELDLVIRHPGIGNGTLDEAYLIQLFYFTQLKKRLGEKTTTEQVCALCGDLNTETHFTKLHEKRGDAFYQNLFLNRRLIHPLDPAFEFDPLANEIKPIIDPATGQLVIDPVTGRPKLHKLVDHYPAILAALGICEADLVLLQALVRSDGTRYITDDLTLANLSFLWRHAWLAKLLKLKAEEWKTLFKLFQGDLDPSSTPFGFEHFGTPKAAWEFVEDVDRLKAAGFTPDELNWLLAADRSATAATKETDAALFLAALRKELRAIQTEYDLPNYDFLTAEPPTDLDRLTALLTSLLQKLNRNEADVDFFLAALRGEVRLVAPVQGLPPAFTFPAAMVGAPNYIPIQYDEPNRTLHFTGLITNAQKTILLSDPSLAEVRDMTTYRQAIEELFQQSLAASNAFISVSAMAPGLQGFALPATAPSIPIHYDEPNQMLHFVGLMTVANKETLLTDLSLAEVRGNAAYTEAIEELFSRPRLALKFFEPVFTAALANLPAAADFKTLSDPGLALRSSYDAEQRLLRFDGIMSADDKAALDALSSDGAYLIAVNSLYTQPRTIAPPDERIWLIDADLNTTVPANNTTAKRLANAAQKALVYLSEVLSENAVVQQASSQLGLSEALTRWLLTHYAVLPGTLTLMTDLAGSFATTAGVVDYTTRKTIFDGWFWANRVAAILKKWKITQVDLEKIAALTAGAQLLDFLTLPLDDTGPLPSIARFLRTHRLLHLRDSLPESDITLIEVLGKLSSGAYIAEAATSIPSIPPQQLFAADVERLNEAWLADDMEQITSMLDLAYPADYLLAESWDRLRRVFYYLDCLNAGAATVGIFAAAAMRPAHASTLNELLRSKFGAETWLALNAEIQDVLRERKRDALAAYLLAHPQPVDAPTGKWEDTNDLYAYYLLDVEMSSCQLTSRLVQATGSVQLFVQRCFMGLEPCVEVKAGSDGSDQPCLSPAVEVAAEGDTAWRWWTWMRKYRVWEANRKIFLWPENWIEPELRKDKSAFFKDLENELLQNELSQQTIETAYVNYLEKLKGVAQLEIAGFYQEDDGDDTILHVFGRTPGAEPHLYYYRRYDYRQWTPWEQVELDITGDYLVPAVVNGRLFLFWPVFTEVPDEDNSTPYIEFDLPNSLSGATIQKPDDQTGASQINAPSQKISVQKPRKKARLQMATSEYRQGKWTPKKVSKDMDESGPYILEMGRENYVFLPFDTSVSDGRFRIRYYDYGLVTDDEATGHLYGDFEITGCDGVPEHIPSPVSGDDVLVPVVRPEPASTGDSPTFMKWVEGIPRVDSPENDFTLEKLPAEIPLGVVDAVDQWVLRQTPGIFKISPPWHLSYFDQLWFDGLQAGRLAGSELKLDPLMGTWLPFFYNDKKRTFFVLPALPPPYEGQSRLYYPVAKQTIRQLEEISEKWVQSWVDSLTLPDPGSDTWNGWEDGLRQAFPEEAPPVGTTFTPEELKCLGKRWLMRFVHRNLGFLSFYLFHFRQFHFKNFYHPFVCDFATLVNNPLKGIPALMSRETQLRDTGFSFDRVYQPVASSVVKLPPEYPSLEDCYPREMVDFTPDGAYSPYNWEMFFHAPLLIADSLSQNQRFEEARDWYHFIFNPLGAESAKVGSSPTSKYWITKPFFETTDPDYVKQRIDNILHMLASDKSTPPAPLTELENQVIDWRKNPSEPHRIANYRTVAYQKAVVMKYLDNLIAWGDYLFRQDSMESINEAALLYILAAEILGHRPKMIPPPAKPALESFNELESEFDTFSNALVQVENLIAVMPSSQSSGADTQPLPMLYFCIPQNEKMLGYWDTVADRLYKIRNCMNIEGVVRQLALFEPPIDPGALVKAVAAGMDISSALADLNAPLPLYRFNVLLQKANEVCNDVRALGGALLAALEKRDGEALSLLRQGQEVTLLEAVEAVRKQQIDEAKENLTSLQRSKELATFKRDYYLEIEKIIAGEQLALDQLRRAQEHQNKAQNINIGASVLGYIPSLTIGTAGFGGTAEVNLQWGTGNIISALQAASGSETLLANIASYEANTASTLAGYDRRYADWKLQEALAEREINQIDSQISAADLRVKLAEKELANHELQIENAKATDAFMRSKYTNQELYQWQVGQISGVYFQNYRLAYDLAKRAERCFRFELGLPDTSYINFGYWDSLKKGLLSGEKLQYDLRRLEAAYLEQNRREFEITKHVSLLLLDPLALVRLRETGRCFFRLPEESFDLDYPGHYFRRIKSVSLTLPCVTGPYTTIACTLRLLRNTVRIKTAIPDNRYPRNVDDRGFPADDNRFVENNIPVKAIAASGAQNDSGVFELSFRDERYLPFEGAGVISEWSLELFSDLPSNNPDFGKPLRQFDYSTIADAVLHIRYTAREDAGAFKNAAIKQLREYYTEDGTTHSLRLLNLRQEFPSQWYRFLNPVNPADGNVFELEMAPGLFSFRDQEKTITINTVWLLARCTYKGDYSVEITPPLPTPPGGTNAIALAQVNQYGGLYFGVRGTDTPMGIELAPTDPLAKWKLTMSRPGLDSEHNLKDEVEDVFLVLGYESEKLVNQ